MNAETSTGFDLPSEFYLWGFSVWGDNEFSAFTAENQEHHHFFRIPVWDWKPRRDVVETLNGQPVPEWYRLPYVVQMEAGV